MQDIRIKTAELYTRYADILYRTAYAKLLSAHDAEDAVSETFAKYLGKTPEFRDSSHERAWFLRVCINTCTDIMRRRSVRSYTPLDELAEVLPAAEKDAHVLESVYALPEKYRLCVLLYYFENLNVEETAESLKISVSAVKMRLSRARDMLKTELV